MADITLSRLSSYILPWQHESSEAGVHVTGQAVFGRHVGYIHHRVDNPMAELRSRAADEDCVGGDSLRIDRWVNEGL